MTNIDDLDFDPEDIGDFGYPGEGGDDINPVAGIHSDPGIVAYLDQQQEDWQQRKESFLRFYGFDHNCECAEDYAADKVESVTECFIRLCAEALDRCVVATQENKMLSMYLNEMLKMNNELTNMMKENGLEDKLEDYFNREMEFEDVEGDDFEQMSFPDEWPESEDDDGEEELIPA